MSDKKKGFALKEFKDAGTNETFEAERVHDFDPGSYANYAAGGLVREPTTDELRAAKAEAAKVEAPKA